MSSERASTTVLEGRALAAPRISIAGMVQSTAHSDEPLIESEGAAQ